MTGLLSVLSQDISESSELYIAIIGRNLTIHAGQKLRDDPSFHFSLSTLSFGSYCVYFIDE
jgi:hypothetical protein